MAFTRTYIVFLAASQVERYFFICEYDNLSTIAPRRLSDIHEREPLFHATKNYVISRWNKCYWRWFYAIIWIIYDCLLYTLILSFSTIWCFVWNIFLILPSTISIHHLYFRLIILRQSSFSVLRILYWCHFSLRSMGLVHFVRDIHTLGECDKCKNGITHFSN